MLQAFLYTIIYFTTFFIVATIIKNNSIVDIGWGLGYVVVSWLLFFISNEYTITKIIVNILVSLWGLRLFYHILKRNAYQEEDFRYKNWRKSWGKYVIPRAFLQVFMLQGTLQFLIGSATYYININDLSFNNLSILGIVIWLIGYYFQVVGDKQLKNHVSNRDNKGKLLDTGLWRYTRHPNYFGESVMWFGIFLYAALNGLPVYYIISPLTITVVLYFISTPLLEENMKKYEGWENYKKRTPMFIPIKLK
jgi:steroid 5-alpha reductase family enzyme